jgi:hypothetical protein
MSPSDRSMALGSNQSLVKMSTRNIPGGKGGRCVKLTSPTSRAECHEIWQPKPPGTLWATPGLLRYCFTFVLHPHKIPAFAIQTLELGVPIPIQHTICPPAFKSQFRRRWQELF